MTIKVGLVLQRCYVEAHGSRVEFVHPDDGEIYSGPLGDITLVSLQASDLITRMLYHGNEKRVHVGNEIKLGMEIPRIESRTCNISRDKGI